MTFATHLTPQANGGVGLAFTNRWGGVSAPPYADFNLGAIGQDQPRALAVNFARLTEAIGCGGLAMTSQVHGSEVALVTATTPLYDPVWLEPGRRPPVADAMVTTLAGVGLVIRVADCVPVLLADPKRGVIAAAHAGRVGLLGGVLERTVAVMRDQGAVDLVAWIGPHIKPECYEVPPDMAAAAWRQVPATRGRTAAGTTAIDLGAGAEAILTGLGAAVQRYDPCTACTPDFFSHRRDHGVTGRSAGVIWRAAATGRVDALTVEPASTLETY